MKTKLNNSTSPASSINTLLCAGANDSNLHEAHGLEGFGSGSDSRPSSWCAVLIKFIVEL